MLARRGDGSSKLAPLWVLGTAGRAGNPTLGVAGTPAPGIAGKLGWLRDTDGKSMPPRCGAVAGSAVTPGSSSAGQSSSIPVGAAEYGGDASGAVERTGAAGRGDGRSTPAERPTAGKSASKLDAGAGA